jgi:hypothetical protein
MQMLRQSVKRMAPNQLRLQLANLSKTQRRKKTNKGFHQDVAQFQHLDVQLSLMP